MPPRRTSGPRGYSFTELLTIKVIKHLMESGIRAGRIKETLAGLKQELAGVDNPLTEKALFVWGKEICVMRDGKACEVRTGQYHLFQVGDYTTELRHQIERLGQGEPTIRSRRKERRSDETSGDHFGELSEGSGADPG